MIKNVREVIPSKILTKRFLDDIEGIYFMEQIKWLFAVLITPNHNLVNSILVMMIKHYMFAASMR